MKALLLSGTLVWALSSTPASAGDADCIWEHLPLNARRSAFAAYERGGADALGEVRIDDSAVLASYRACTRRASATPAAAIGPALVGAALEHAAMRHLNLVDGIDPMRLERAWRGLAPAERQSLRAAYLAPDAEIPAAAFAAIDKAVELAGYRPAPVAHVVGDARYRHLADFFEGRAQKEAYQLRF